MDRLGGESVDPRTLALSLSQRRESYQAVTDRLAITRCLSVLQKGPLTADYLVAWLRSLSSSALSLGIICCDIFHEEALLAESLVPAWDRSINLHRELGPDLDAHALATLALESMWLSELRSLGSVCDAEEACEQVAPIEYLIRCLCLTMDVATCQGRIQEDARRRKAALERLNPLAQQNAARDLALDQRYQKAIAALQQKLASGAALPEATEYRGL